MHQNWLFWNSLFCNTCVYKHITAGRAGYIRLDWLWSKLKYCSLSLTPYSVQQLVEAWAIFSKCYINCHENRPNFINLIPNFLRIGHIGICHWPQPDAPCKAQTKLLTEYHFSCKLFCAIHVYQGVTLKCMLAKYKKHWKKLF